MSHHDRMKQATPTMLRPAQEGAPPMTTHNAIVTPKEAEETLRAHTNIRTLNEARVRAHLADMLAGAWEENFPQGLVFDQQGKLINGQHRLTAQVRSGLTLSWTVTVNAPPGVVLLLDTVLPRPAAVGLAAKFGGSPRVWKQAAGVGRLIRFAAKGVYTHISQAEQKRLIDSLEEPGVSAVYAHSGAPRLNIPTRAAFVYAWPCDGAVEQLWLDVVAGYPQADASGEYQKTFAVMQGCVTRRLGENGITQRDSFYQQLRCIQAIVAGEGLQQAKAFPVSFEKFTEQRRRLDKLPVYPSAPKAIPR